MSTEIPQRIVEERVKGIDKETSISELINKLILLNASGALDTLIDLALTLKNLSSIVTDDMVDNMAVIAGNILELISSMADNPIVKAVEDSINDPNVDEALLRIGEAKVGLSDIIRLLKDPDVLAGIYVFLTIMKAVGVNLRRIANSVRLNP